jgi:tetratricopeptide (TPR) repeat protein
MNYPGKILTGVWGAVLLLTLTLVAPAAPAGDEVPASAVSALLAGNWQQVDAQLPGVTPQTPSPVLRLIKGHACLALNRNNESLCLFMSIATPSERQEWFSWTEALGRAHPNQATPLYLKGDALARLRQWAEANESLNLALKLKPTFALAMNAQGVVHAAQQQFDKAILDFAHTAEVMPSLADAYANRGALYIQKKSGARGALRWLDQALKKSPDFSLAFYQRGCIKFVLGDYVGGKKDIESAKQKHGCLDKIMTENLEKVAEWIESQERLQVAEAKGEDPGTEINRELGKLTQGDVGSLNRIARRLGTNPEYADKVNQRIDIIRKNNPDLGKQIDRKIGNGREWTSDTGGGRGWVNFMDSSVTVGTGKVDAGFKVGPKLIEQQLQKTQNDNSGWKSMNTKSDPMGGVTTRPDKMQVEEGNWPFIVNYGLAYEIKQ